MLCALYTGSERCPHHLDAQICWFRSRECLRPKNQGLGQPSVGVRAADHLREAVGEGRTRRGARAATARL